MGARRQLRMNVWLPQAGPEGKVWEASAQTLVKAHVQSEFAERVLEGGDSLGSGLTEQQAEKRCCVVVQSQKEGCSGSQWISKITHSVCGREDGMGRKALVTLRSLHGPLTGGWARATKGGIE